MSSPLRASRFRSFIRAKPSDAWRVAAFLAVSGGLQDAYSYFERGRVFANAQTGNIVLLGAKICEGDFAGAARYVLPLCAFVAGVFAAEWLRQHATRLHWRQNVLLVEMLLLAVVGILPNSLDAAANAIVSFSCAMQVQAFRKLHGNAYASTMCIGNLRSLASWAERAVSGEGRHAWRRAERYLGVIALFALGATLGAFLAPRLGIRTIWVSCALLVVSFAQMFERGK